MTGVKLIVQYLYNLGLCISQVISVILGGHPDMSVSQRTGLAYQYHRKRGGWKKYWFTAQLACIDALFWNPLWKLEKDHCMNSLRGESLAKELWSWTR